jgi:NAD(P)-dependent dehydrogenase (short-subunit alcohol dehydrogenase family)
MGGSDRIMDLANKTAMITGAVGNLGTAVSTCLKAAGAKTIVVDRSQERLEQIYKSGPECLLAGNADLTSEESVGKVVASALKHFGRIDALINTVGGFRGGKAVHEEELSTWDMMMMVNLRTTVLMCRAVIPAMLANGAGSIVNVSAGAALSGPPGLAAYSASKAAVLRFTESLAAEGYHTAGFFGGPYLHDTFGLGDGFEVWQSCMTALPDDRSMFDTIGARIAGHGYGSQFHDED